MMKDIVAPPYNYEITMTGMRRGRQIIQKEREKRYIRASP
jgi:hypothetical protein